MSLFSVHIVAGNTAEKDLDKLQLKYTPYFMIAIFAGLTAILRWYLIPEWGWWHLPLMLYQCLVFTGFWQLIKYINKRLNNVYPFQRGPLKRMALQNIITILCLLPFVATAFLLAHDHFPEFATRHFQAVMILVFAIVIFMFNFAFFSLHFYTHWQHTVVDKAALEVQAAELEREKYDLQYHQLRNQVNPHYLFNTLTSLDGLIHTNPELASEFVRHMSKVYRYVLQHKESEVVNMEEEIEFIGHYINLLNIRYGSALAIHLNISQPAKEKGIVMVTLQMLIDNAIKHNIIQAAAPLKIVIWDEGDYLLVHNNKQLRKQIETSNGMGLKQLRQLYGYITDKPLIIDDSHDHYTIKIPLL